MWPSHRHLIFMARYEQLPCACRAAVRGHVISVLRALPGGGGDMCACSLVLIANGPICSLVRPILSEWKGSHTHFFLHTQACSRMIASKEDRHIRTMMQFFLYTTIYKNTSTRDFLYKVISACGYVHTSPVHVHAHNTHRGDSIRRHPSCRTKMSQFFSQRRARCTRSPQATFTQKKRL
jgi:hypothetical protein